jgi:hypothetical protein
MTAVQNGDSAAADYHKKALTTVRIGSLVLLLGST